MFWGTCSSPVCICSGCHFVLASPTTSLMFLGLSAALQQVPTSLLQILMFSSPSEAGPILYHLQRGKENALSLLVLSGKSNSCTCVWTPKFQESRAKNILPVLSLRPLSFQDRLRGVHIMQIATIYPESLHLSGTSGFVTEFWLLIPKNPFSTVNS